MVLVLGMILLIVLVGDKMGDLFVQEELYFTAELLDGVFDLVRKLVFLDVQVEAVVYQGSRAFHEFHFIRRSRFLLLIGCDPRKFRFGGRYHAFDIEVQPGPFLLRADNKTRHVTSSSENLECYFPEHTQFLYFYFETLTFQFT